MIVAGIPAYNEEKTIAKVILNAQKHVDFVLVCDDGSNDMTAEISQKLGAVVIRHETNLGYGSAIKSLFEKARDLQADALITLDADGQHDAEEIQALVEPLIAGKADITIGSRFINGTKEIPRYRRLGIKFLTKMTNGNGKGRNLTDTQCGFRGYNKRAIESLDLHVPGMGASVEVLMQAKAQGMTIAEVPVGVHYHDLETSTQNPVTHGMSVLSTILRLVVEDRPLVYIGIPGVFILIIGISFGIWTVQLYTVEHYMVTNPLLFSIAFTLVGILCIFTAVMLFAIARQKERPQRLSTIIRLVVKERPLVYLGIPGVLVLIVGIFFGMWAVQLYTIEHHMVTNPLLFSIAFTLVGILCIFTAVMLFALIRQKERLLQNRSQ